MSNKSLNPLTQCREYGLPPWQCPQVLFVVLGIIIIATIIVTNAIARRLVPEEVVALIILAVTALLFVVSYVVVSSFERVAEASLAKSDFVSIMSHRLRTPLSVVRWRLDALYEKHGPMTVEEARSAFDDIYKQNEKLVMLVNDLLDVSRIEDGALRLTPAPFDLRELLSDVIGVEESLITAKELQIKLDGAEAAPRAYADPLKIRNVIFHLLDNAIRFSPARGTIAISIGEESGLVGARAARVRMTVSDEGIGIPREKFVHLFERYRRVRREYSMETGGVGVGLYIAKQIVERSGGRIGVESIEGRGSTFWFTLPTAP